MDFFAYKNGQLFAEDVAVADIAAQYQTPVYVYSRATLERHWHAFNDAIGEHPHLICYAVKANSNLGVLSTLAKIGSGFDIVSGGELARVIEAGGDASKVVFSGVGKKADEIRYALEQGIMCFNVESEPELHRINAVAESLGKKAPISLRINPDVDAKTHPYISTGLKANKFGIARERALQTYELAASLPYLNVVGMDCHIGSQLTEIGPFVDALERLLLLIDELAERGITIDHLDVGGGLGVTYNDEEPPHPKAYAAAMAEKMVGRENLKLILEPGRAIAANAGILVTEVEFIKEGEEKSFAIVDAAMNDLLRPALYSNHHHAVLNIPCEALELFQSTHGVGMGRKPRLLKTLAEHRLVDDQFPNKINQPLDAIKINPDHRFCCDTSTSFGWFIVGIWFLGWSLNST